MLLAREGISVLVHGTPTETSRVFASEVLSLLGIQAQSGGPVAGSSVNSPSCPLKSCAPALKHLLDVRRVVGLRNPAHSLVKIMNPCLGKKPGGQQLHAP